MIDLDATFGQELFEVPDSPWPEAVLDEWVASSPLAKVTFAETD